MPRRNPTKPTNTSECPTGPCPFVSCRYHLYLDVSKGGQIKINFPGIEPTDLMFPCALRLAAMGDRGPTDVGRYAGMDVLTVENTSQLAYKKLRNTLIKLNNDYADTKESDLQSSPITEFINKLVA